MTVGQEVEVGDGCRGGRGENGVEEGEEAEWVSEDEGYEVCMCAVCVVAMTTTGARCAVSLCVLCPTSISL